MNLKSLIPEGIEAMKMCTMINCCGDPHHSIGGSGIIGCMVWLVCGIPDYDIISLKDVIYAKDLLCHLNGETRVKKWSAENIKNHYFLGFHIKKCLLCSNCG